MVVDKLSVEVDVNRDDSERIKKLEGAIQELELQSLTVMNIANEKREKLFGKIIPSSGSVLSGGEGLVGELTTSIACVKSNITDVIRFLELL